MKIRLALLLLAALALPSCGGGGLSGLLGVPAAPTASPAPTMQVSPSSVTLNVGATATITASENSANASFTAQSTDDTIATVVQGTAPNAFVITGVKSGQCNILITDAFQKTQTVSVTVH